MIKRNYNKSNILANNSYMRTIRAFFTDIHDEISTISITGEYFNYFKNVLRLKKSDTIELFNNKDNFQYTSTVIEINNKSIELEILSKNIIENENSYSTNLYQSLIKLENFELVIQKATELGVNNIHPIITDYTNLKFDRKNIDKKLDRWQKIAVSASEQCRRVFIPRIHEPTELKNIDINQDQLNITLCPYTKNDLKFEEQIKVSKEINIFIGPEGGFSDSEMSLFKSKMNFSTINLGKRILKAETASINILSVINFLK